MELRVKGSDAFLLVSAIVGFMSFFLPWLNLGFMGQFSAYELLSVGKEIGEDRLWLLVILPISFLIIGLIRLNLINISNVSAIKLIELVPLFFILTALMVLGEKLNYGNESLRLIEAGLREVLDVGFYLCLLTAIVAAFSPFRDVASSSSLRVESQTSKNEERETRIEQSDLIANEEEDAGTLLDLSENVASLPSKTSKRTTVYVLAGIALISVVLIFVWLRSVSVERAGEDLANAQCECLQAYDESIIEKYDLFQKELNQKKFVYRQLARDRLNALTQGLNEERERCLLEVSNKYQAVSENYRLNRVDLNKFEAAYNDKVTECWNALSNGVSNRLAIIENDINAIPDQEPDIDRIKEDLIGRQVFGWNFEDLSEFQEVKVLQVTRENNKLYYKLSLKLKSLNSNTLHDAEMDLTYVNNEMNWHINETNVLFITYDYLAVVDSWGRIDLLDNCRCDILDNGKRYWAQDGLTGTVYKGGVGGEPFNLTGSYIFIQSREDTDVILTFKYYPATSIN